jgi:fructokinase
MPTSPESTPKLVLAYGELLWDLLPSGAVLGGAPANFAYRINSLGARGLMISRLGRDVLGQAAAERVAALGMETQQLQWSDHLPTGTVQVALDECGNPDFFIVPGVAYDEIRPDEGLLRLAEQADCLCFGTLVQRAAQSRRTLRQVLEAGQGALAFLDINLRKECYSTETIRESLEHADILKVNRQEAEYLASLFNLPAAPLDIFAEAALARWDLSHCLITLADKGAFVFSSAGEKVYGPGYQVPLADSCGAGDACSAGFVHGLLTGESTARSLEIGNALGALVATQRGATEPIPAKRLANFLAGSSSRAVERSLEKWSVG